jgi:hypothetical protein
MKGSLGIVKKFFPNVKKVTDATENSFIEVTAKDASSKAVRDHGACVMAVACKRKLNLDGVIIARSVAYLIKDGKATRYKLPQSVSREIVSFDRGAGFEIGKYQLDKIRPSQKLGARHERANDERENHQAQGKAKTPKFKHITTNIRSVLGGRRPEGE